MKKIGIVILILILALVGVIFYLWKQATTLPEWYTTGPLSPADGSVIIYGKGIEDVRKQLQQKIEKGLKEGPDGKMRLEISLSENELNGLFASVITENAEEHEYLKAVKASKTSIKDGNLDIGAIVDISGIPTEDLEPAARGTTEKIIDTLSTIGGREVYVGISGRHSLKNGMLKLDDNGTIRLGAMSFSLAEISRRIGVSEDKLRRALRELELGKLRITDIVPEKNFTMIKGFLD
jgi:hypothetical protein